MFPFFFMDWKLSIMERRMHLSQNNSILKHSHTYEKRQSKNNSKYLKIFLYKIIHPWVRKKLLKCYRQDWDRETCEEEEERGRMWDERGKRTIIKQSLKLWLSSDMIAVPPQRRLCSTTRVQLSKTIKHIKYFKKAFEFQNSLKQKWKISLKWDYYASMAALNI